MTLIVELFVECNECPNRYRVDRDHRDGSLIKRRAENARQWATNEGWLCFKSKISPTGRAYDVCPQCQTRADLKAKIARFTI